MNLTEEKIVFQRTRDVGEVISTTFRFLKENLRTLFLGALYFMAPFFVLGSIFFVSSFNAILLSSKSPTGMDDTTNWVSLLVFFIGMIFYGLGFIMQVTYVNETIKYVASNPDAEKPTVSDIWKTTKKKFWANILHAIVWLILTSLGSLALNLLFMAFVPFMVVGGISQSVAVIAILMIIFFLLTILAGAYMYSTSMPIFFISTYENTNIFNAIGRSLSLMHLRKENFWGSIFVNAILGIIYFILSSNFLLPMSIISGIVSYNTGGFDNLDENSAFRIILITGAVVATFIQIFCLSILLIGVAIKYFDWVERIDGKGLSERIKTIGHNTDFDPSMYEESY